MRPNEFGTCRPGPPQEMADQGLYRFALPLELGGENLSAREQIEVVEAASAIDGSVGWCTQISSEINALVIRRMDLPLVEKIFNDWHVLVCSGHGPANGPNPGRNARRDGEGWRLNYQGSFASGCHNATWNYLMGPMVIDEETGAPAQASYMVPWGEFEIVDTWDTAGMRGSGSHDVLMADCYVPPEHLLPFRSLAPSETWGQPNLPQSHPRDLQQGGRGARRMPRRPRFLHRTGPSQNALGHGIEASGPSPSAVSDWPSAGHADGGAHLRARHPGPLGGALGAAAKPRRTPSAGTGMSSGPPYWPAPTRRSPAGRWSGCSTTRRAPRARAWTAPWNANCGTPTKPQPTP